MEFVETRLQPLFAYFDGHPYLLSGLIVVLTLLLANAVTWTLIGLLKRAAKMTDARFDDLVVQAARHPLLYSIVMIGFSIAVKRLPMSEASHATVIAVLQSVGIFVWMRFFLTVSKAALNSLSHDDNRLKLVQTQTLPLFQNIAMVVIVALALYLLFTAWGIDMSAWLASAGIVGIAVGFAAKDTLSNLFSGVFILADAPYKIGDYVVLDSGERGEVTHIGIRSTRMLTRDDVELTIPNAVMGNSKVINESGGPHPKYRIRVPVGVAYGSDVDQVRELLMQIGRDNTSVCRDPEHRVRFRALGASSLDFELLCWVDEPALRGRVVDSLLTEIYKTFNREGVEIPYAKQDIYIKEWPKG